MNIDAPPSVVRRRHIAIVAPPTAGHINPLFALGTRLIEIGHRVTLVHLGEVARGVGEGGIGFAALGGAGDRPGMLDAYLADLARPTGPVGLPRMIRATAGITRMLLEALPAALDRIGADAVIADSAEPAGALVARHLGLPFVTSVTGLPLLREPDLPPPYLGWRYRPGPLGRFRNAGGYGVSDLLLRPIERVLDEARARWGLEDLADDGLSPRLQIAQCPAALDFPRAALPAAFRYGAAWRLAEPPLPAFPRDDRPLIFCSLGSLQGGRRRLLATMTRACARIGARAVLAHGGALSRDEETALPGDPLVRAFWPQTQMMPHCTAAILHGGFNSVLDALAAELPIVAMPIAFEQPATAARLARVGAARIVRPATAGTAGLARALSAVIAEPGYRAAARRLAEPLRIDGARTAAAQVSDALAG